MIKFEIKKGTMLEHNESTFGQTIEEQVREMIYNGAPVTDNAPLIYTERKDGVEPAYNIRTDRQEYAIEATELAAKAHYAQRAERLKDKTPGSEEPGDNV